MTPPQRDLIQFLHRQPRDPFSIAGQIDDRRCLPRNFPGPVPLQLSLQSYPHYEHMVGENWMHWHDYYELWIATEGSGEFRAGNHSFEFAPGDLVLVDPLKIHGVLRMQRKHTPLVAFFRTEAVAPTGAEVDLAFLSAFDRRPEKIPPVLRGDSPLAGQVQGAMLRLAECWFDPHARATNAVTLKFHLLEVLLHLRHAFLTRDSAPLQSMTMRAEREAKLGRVLGYVSENLHQSVAQPEAARIAGMSTSRFRLFFKETTGWGFADYVRDLRLERAAELLRETCESVAEVAYRTGFADQSHLQRLFKAKYRISPLAYRKERTESSVNGSQRPPREQPAKLIS